MKRYLPSAIAFLVLVGPGCSVEESRSLSGGDVESVSVDGETEAEEPEDRILLPAPTPWIPPFASEV